MHSEGLRYIKKKLRQLERRLQHLEDLHPTNMEIVSCPSCGNLMIIQFPDSKMLKIPSSVEPSKTTVGGE